MTEIQGCPGDGPRSSGPASSQWVQAPAARHPIGQPTAAQNLPHPTLRAQRLLEVALPVLGDDLADHGPEVDPSGRQQVHA